MWGAKQVAAGSCTGPGWTGSKKPGIGHGSAEKCCPQHPKPAEKSLQGSSEGFLGAAEGIFGFDLGC